MGCEDFFWFMVFALYGMLALQAWIAFSGRSEHWKTKGYEMCLYCGKWRPKDEMYAPLKCWRCADRKPDK